MQINEFEARAAVKKAEGEAKSKTLNAEADAQRKSSAGLTSRGSACDPIGRDALRPGQSLKQLSALSLSQFLSEPPWNSKPTTAQLS